MRAMCDERDQLWASYDHALTAYIAAIAEYGHSLDPDRAAATLRERVTLVSTQRDAFHQHCKKHACDPEYLRAMKG
jgi:hypothetical protein